MQMPQGLFTYDGASGDVSAPLGTFGQLKAITFRQAGEALFGLEAERLLSIDPGNGAVLSILGGSGLRDVESIAYNDTSGVLYGYSPLAGGRLCSINVSNGTATSLGAIGAFDLICDNGDADLMLYSQRAGGSLWTLNTSTFAKVLVTTGVGHVVTLARLHEFGGLVVMFPATGQNPTTWNGSAIGAFAQRGYGNLQASAWRRSVTTLYLVGRK
jgi:hypothetical protein